jgi:carboxy-cis,cis-muconate cyclase
MYSVDRTTGQLMLLSDTPSPRAHDGPRHVVVAPNGKTLYSVTEHSTSYPAIPVTSRSDTGSFAASFIDVYTITLTALTHIQSLTILPPGSNSTNYRGDTLRLQPPTANSPTPTHLFATTRGFDTTHKGYLTVFCVLPSGLLDADEETIERWQTPTSGGKANAIELKSKTPEDGGGGNGATDTNGVWIALTDDEPDAGGLWILEWDGEREGHKGGIRIVTEWSGEGEGDGKVSMDGSSHAVWLD